MMTSRSKPDAEAGHCVCCLVPARSETAHELNVEVGDGERVLLDELAARLDVNLSDYDTTRLTVIPLKSGIHASFRTLFW
jgi:hypothetical protein